MTKHLLLSTIFASAFIAMPVFAADTKTMNNDTNHQGEEVHDKNSKDKNLTPARKAEENKDNQSTNIQGTTEGAIEGTEKNQKNKELNSDEKNLSPARKARENVESEMD